MDFLTKTEILKYIIHKYLDTTIQKEKLQEYRNAWVCEYIYRYKNIEIINQLDQYWKTEIKKYRKQKIINAEKWNYRNSAVDYDKVWYQ